MKSPVSSGRTTNRLELGADPSEGAELHLEELMGLILWPPDFINTELLRRVQKKMPAVIIDTRVPGIGRRLRRLRRC